MWNLNDEGSRLSENQITATKRRKLEENVAKIGPVLSLEEHIQPVSGYGKKIIRFVAKFSIQNYLMLFLTIGFFFYSEFVGFRSIRSAVDLGTIP